MSWQKLRQDVLNRDDCKCRRCGIETINLEIHHIQPRKLGGIDSLDNLISLCHKCHTAIEPRNIGSENLVKTIKISEETHAELNSIGVRGESFENIVKRLIKFYKENNKKK